MGRKKVTQPPPVDLGAIDQACPTQATDQSQLISSQSSTSEEVDDSAVGQLPSCATCTQVIIGDPSNVNALKCCLCSLSFHGQCLKLTCQQISSLNIVRDIGGWCCTHCRDDKAPSRVSTRQKKKPTAVELINQDILQIKQQLQEVAHLLSSAPAPQLRELSAGAEPNLQVIANQASAHKATYAEALRNKEGTQRTENRIAPDTDSDIRTRHLSTTMLSALHTELNSVKKRAHNLVITGLPEKELITDASQVVELITSELNIIPSVCHTRRIGQNATSTGKHRPLIVTMESEQSAQCIVAIAKDLRRSNNKFVQENIFINKHLTRAESQAAYNERESRRRRAQNIKQPCLGSNFQSTQLDRTDILDPLPSHQTSRQSSNRPYEVVNPKTPENC